jgi:hypothetical protein
MTRLVNAWRALAPEQQLAALAALGLFVSMFLPWYDKTDTVVVHGAAKATQTSLSAFQAFSFVEAAVLLVSAGVLVMLFERAEGRVFQLPGGDGVIVLAAGAWTALLIFYRLLDKPGLEGTERITATVGVEWGIFIALLLALAVAYAGGRMRALERPGPPLRRARGARPRPPMDPQPARGPRRSMPAPLLVDAQPPRAAAAPVPADLDATVVVPGSTRRPRSMPAAASEPGATRGRGASRERGERPRYPPAPPEQLSFEDPPTRSE